MDVRLNRRQAVLAMVYSLIIHLKMHVSFGHKPNINNNDVAFNIVTIRLIDPNKGLNPTKCKGKH